MKINTALNTFETNSESVSHEFSIGDPAVIIDILRNRLYSNPIQTLVQEYVSNARDACREASLEERIVVTLPSESSRTFKVRDYGVGLSPERVASVFVRYASSTKRGSNDQIGGFGIGAKSAWSYTDNFTVTSYYNNVARHYIAHLGKTNAGSLDLLSEAPTSEANGCEIQIAVAEKDISAFHAAVFRCTFFWKIRPELRGIAPSSLPDWYRFPKCKASVENVSFYNVLDIPPCLHGNCYTLCIDGIPYGVTYRFSEEYSENIIDTRHHAVLHIPTGKVEVSASRESLSDGTKNKAFVKALFEETNVALRTHAQAALKACASLGEYIKKFGQMQEFFEVGRIVPFSISYKLLDDRLYIDDSPSFNGTFLTNDEYVLEATRKGDAFRLEQGDKPVWNALWKYVLFVDDGEYSGKPVCNAKVRKHLLTLPEKGFRGAIVFKGADAEALSKFAKDIGAIPLSTIELDKPVKNAAVAPKNEVVVTVYTDRPDYHRSGHDTTIVQLDTDMQQYVYAVKEATDAFTEQKRAMGEVASFVQEYTARKFCFVAAGNVKKLNVNFVPVEQVTATPLQYLSVKGAERFESHVIASGLSDGRELAISMKNCKEFMQLKDGVKDSALVELLNLASGIASYVSLNRSNAYTDAVARTYSHDNPHVKILIATLNDKVKILEAYPLLKELFDSYPAKDKAFYEEVVWYINTKHASKGSK